MQRRRESEREGGEEREIEERERQRRTERDRGQREEERDRAYEMVESEVVRPRTNFQREQDANSGRNVAQYWRPRFPSITK